ncbi:MAG TPA: ferritin [Candidatus Krumholzibacteriaceae bacterium]
MITKKIQAGFNEQINHEFYSAYLYLSMAAYFHSLNLEGFANWMRVQTKEETAHAMKFLDHLRDRGARVELEAIDKPKMKWTSPLDAFKAAYEHEKFITGRINGLYRLAEKGADYAAKVFLDWFVKEQVEEEASASNIVQMLGRIKDSGAGLIMLDKELGKREFHG